MTTTRKRLARRVLLLASPLLAFLLADGLLPLHLPDKQHLFAQVVVDRDGHPLKAFADEKGVWRYPTSLATVSPFYLEAVLQYEDRRFWWHPGVDPIAISRAAASNLLHGRRISGGSTLTMQVARLLHPHSKTLPGKLHQLFRALQLEWHLSKKDILTLYCNIAPFGGTIEGVQAASFTYLNKSAQDLTRAEAALLAILPQSPTRYRPDLHPQAAEQARNKVLARLAQLQIWSEDEVQQALLEPVYAVRNRIDNHANLLARRLAKGSNENLIRTHIRRDLQITVEDYVKTYIATQPEKTSAAVLIVDNQSNEVLAYVGAAEFGNAERFGYVDMVTAIRSPGSTLKPFLYALAFDDGLIHSHSLMTDAPLKWRDYQPGNFSGAFSGPVTATAALQRSLNIPAVDLLDHYGPNRFQNRLENAGLHLRSAGQNASLAFILGGAGTNLEELVRAYGAFAKQGQTQALRFSSADQSDRSQYFFTPQAAWLTQDILRGVGRPDQLRSASSLKRKTALAWKTGTSYGMRDAWAIGVAQNYTLGVWVGRPDGSYVPDNTGRTSAGPLLHTLADYFALEAIAKPDGISQQTICWPLGTLASEQAPEHCHRRYAAWIINATVPPTWADTNAPYYDNPLSIWLNTQTHKRIPAACVDQTSERQSFALWPSAVEPWLPHPLQRNQILPAADQSCASVAQFPVQLHIENMEQDTLFQATSDSQTLPTIPLTASGGAGQYHWYVNGEYFQSSLQQQVILPTHSKGEMQIVVIDDAGNIDKRDIRIQ